MVSETKPPREKLTNADVDNVTGGLGITNPGTPIKGTCLKCKKVHWYREKPEGTVFCECGGVIDVGLWDNLHISNPPVH